MKNIYKLHQIGLTVDEFEAISGCIVHEITEHVEDDGCKAS